MSRATVKLRLYVAGDAPNSAQAVTNLAAICRTHLANRYELEIVNVLQQPKRALEDNIMMTPTLLRLAPGPIRRIVGTLSNTQPVLQCLGVQDLAA